MKKILFYAAFFSLLITLPAGNAFAESETPAEKAIQSVKDTVGALIDAKDKNAPGESDARLATYEKILDLALADAKELKVKLLSFDEGKDKPTTTEVLWKKSRIEALSAAITYYEEEREAVLLLESPSMEEVKARAETLKDWRDKTYLPLAEEVQAFLLIEVQKKSLDTSKKRLEKVSADVAKLKKAKFKEIKVVEEKYKHAETLIADAEKINDAAEHKFRKYHLLPFMDKASAEKKALEKELKDEAEARKGAADNTPSIKELVDGSFAKVKEAYQAFIEMSDLVRKSL